MIFAYQILTFPALVPNNVFNVWATRNLPQLNPQYCIIYLRSWKCQSFVILPMSHPIWEDITYVKRLLQLAKVCPRYKTGLVKMQIDRLYWGRTSCTQHIPWNIYAYLATIIHNEAWICYIIIRGRYIINAAHFMQYTYFWFALFLNKNSLPACVIYVPYS